MKRIAANIKYKIQKESGAGGWVGTYKGLTQASWAKFIDAAAKSAEGCLKEDDIANCFREAIRRSNPKTKEYLGKTESVTTVMAGKLSVKLMGVFLGAGFTQEEASYYGDFLRDKILEEHNLKIVD